MAQALTASLPREVVRTRSLIGAWAVISVLQYFLAEAVVISAWAAPQPYSRRFNLISDLGAVQCGIYDEREVCSPLHAVMNASFVLQGSAMIAGAALVSTVVLGVAAGQVLPRHILHPGFLVATRWLIAVSGLGTVIVGLVPEDRNTPIHYIGAVMFFVPGAVALIIIGWSWRRLHWSSWIVLAAGSLSLVSGLVFILDVSPELGTLERLMGYPVTIGLAIVGIRIALGVHRARVSTGVDGLARARASGTADLVAATREDAGISVPADRVRLWVVLASSVLAVIGAFVGSGAAGGTPIQDAAGGALSADSTLIAPAGPAFSIWSVIYAGLIAYAVWQLLPSQAARLRQRRVGYWIAASLLLNAAWILSVQFGFLAFSVVVIGALLAVLARTFVLLRSSRPAGWAEAVVLDGMVGLYLGWVIIATAANLAAVLVSAGFTGWGQPAEAWGVGVIAVAVLVGVVLAIWSGGRLAPSASLSWGLAWVAVSRTTGELLSPPVAVAAGTGAAVVVLVTVLVRLVQPPRREKLPR